MQYHILQLAFLLLSTFPFNSFALTSQYYPISYYEQIIIFLIALMCYKLQSNCKILDMIPTAEVYDHGPSHHSS